MSNPSTEAHEGLKIIKRSGSEVAFDRGKIVEAIRKACASVLEADRATKGDAEAIAAEIEGYVADCGHIPDVEEVQDRVIRGLMEAKLYALAQAYTTYRYKRELVRKSNTTDESIMALIERDNETVKQENANKNPTINSVQRDYMAGEVSKDITKRFLLPPDIWEAHEEGIIHFHDADYYAQHMHNCCLVNLEDILQNGTVISGTLIEKPHSFLTACNIATQAVASIASSQYGGQTFSLAHLAPFVDVSRQKLRREKKKFFADAGIAATPEQIDAFAEEELKKEVLQGVQTIQYQLVTLMTTNGQTPFVSVNMYLNEVEDGQTRDDLVMVIEEVLKQRIEGLKNEKGVYTTPAFPKLLYVLEEDNAVEGSKYWELTRLAAKCTAKRMVPDYISEKQMLRLKGACYPCMGCRSFLTPDRTQEDLSGAGGWEKGRKYYGRFNQGVVTLNLVDVACSSDGDEEKFWELMEERLELCHRALRCRHERLLGTPSDVAPILWQHGALARLKKGETIDRLLYGGYSTISLGYAGLYECTKYMTGESHTDPEKGRPFALRVMQALNDACAKWKKAEDIDYSVYGTPELHWAA